MSDSTRGSPKRLRVAPSSPSYSPRDDTAADDDVAPDSEFANDLPAPLPLSVVFGAAVVAWTPPVAPDTPVGLVEYPEYLHYKVEGIRKGVEDTCATDTPANIMHGFGCLVQLALVTTTVVQSHPHALPYDADDINRFCAIFEEHMHDNFDGCFHETVMCDLTHYLQTKQAGVYYDLRGMSASTTPTVLAVEFISAASTYRDEQ